MSPSGNKRISFLLGPKSPAGRLCILILSIFAPVNFTVHGQNRTTGGYVDAPRAEAPGTLLSHPIHNGSEEMGRTVTLN
jgi:hypothetical protein